MTHAQLVQKAVAWLRSYRCGVILSEQACLSGEMPDAIGWKRACHSVLVECKISRADFLADRDKPFRQKRRTRDWAASASISRPRRCFVPKNCPRLGTCSNATTEKLRLLQPAAKNLRTATGFRYEMNLLLASLRRVEIRIEPQNLTEFLKWKNRLAEYNRGALPEGIVSAEEEAKLLSGDRS